MLQAVHNGLNWRFASGCTSPLEIFGYLRFIQNKRQGGRVAPGHQNAAVLPKRVSEAVEAEAATYANATQARADHRQAAAGRRSKVETGAGATLVMATLLLRTDPI